MNTSYTSEAKHQVLNRHESGESVSTISEDTGIPKSTIYHWIKEAREQTGELNSPKPLDCKALQRKVERLTAIVEILKTVDCTVHSPLQDKLNELEKLYGQYSVHVLCDALDVPRGTFYNHIKRNKRDDTYYSKHREELRVKIQQIYDESHQVYGSDKILAVLQREGYKTSKRMVLELMREMGLASIRQSAKKMYDKEIRSCKNHVNQNFNPTVPNQIWVSDVTYFRYNDKVMYICAVIDLYSRMVIGYRTGAKNSTQLVKSTFKQAYEKRKPEGGLIFHTDRGTNYRSYSMCAYLKELNVTQSFSKAHNPYDNSVMESFFANMKREELYRTKYRSVEELKRSIDKYIKWYNTVRPHKAVKNKTPLEAETVFADKQAL